MKNILMKLLKIVASNNSATVGEFNKAMKEPTVEEVVQLISDKLNLSGWANIK